MVSWYFTISPNGSENIGGNNENGNYGNATTNLAGGAPNYCTGWRGSDHVGGIGNETWALHSKPNMGGIFGGLLSTLIIFLQLNYGLLKIPSDIYFMDQVPFSFDIFVFTVILSLVFIFSIIASWIPVSGIARIKPAVALRYE